MERIPKQGICYKCDHDGKLLYCCGKGCPKAYHPSCLDPPLNYNPLGYWHCISCVKKKIELGVYSISEGVESILDYREVVSENKEWEYFVKYDGLAHAHNRWIPEKQMLDEAPKLLAKFKRKCQVSKWKREWSIPHRLLLKRAIVLSKQNDEHFHGHDSNDSISHYEWLVKWTGLGYDHITWELDDASFMTSSVGIKLIEDYESRQRIADKLRNPCEDEEREDSFAELSVLPSGDLPGIYNHHLTYVKKLHKCWHEGQSALIVDDQIDQERVKKVILFLVSLHGNVKRPILIISTSAALSVWETMFLLVAPSANLVVYKGNKDVRSSIRALEFYNNNSGILFQILLSSSDVIIEDLHALGCIQWEAIIIDECQRPKILGHLDNIKILAAKVRLLLVSGQIKEDRNDYINLLSFLKSGHHGLITAQMETYFSASISNLKEQLEEYVAFKCRSTSFVEYLVPAQLSSLQLEQYCSMLLSNSMLLCSNHKSDSADALHELIISTRKCCNHPYLQDEALQNFVTESLPYDKVTIGIKASGKLQLLENILLEVRSCGSRVIIIFQSTVGSGSIGDILDDVLCHKFGEDCYSRYARMYPPSKKQAAIDSFNDRESGKFVFLIESLACLPSVKLSSVDAVILFDSDWDPLNDLRALQRMSISPQFEHLKVFRLYSFFTVEEKVLMLAKEGIALDSNLQLINQSTCHALLKWGASNLFNKLDDLHGIGTSASTPDISHDQSLLSDVICELSSQLACCGGDTDSHGCSLISRVQQNGRESARNILLLGEREMKKLDNASHCFSWSNLLKERHPRWKFLPVSSRKVRKTSKHLSHMLKESECENDAIIRKSRNVSKNNVDPKRRKVFKDTVDPKKREVSEGVVDPKRRKVSKGVVDPKTKVSEVIAHANVIAHAKEREVPEDIVDFEFLKTGFQGKKKRTARTALNKNATKMNGNMDDLSKVPDFTKIRLIGEVTRAAAVNMTPFDKKKPFDLSKPDISGLCDILHLPKNVKSLAVRILEHILKCYNINCREVSLMQAFEISVCWLAASLLKDKIGRKESLAVAKRFLNFNCKEDEATYVYSELKQFKKVFSSLLENGHCVEECIISGASHSKAPELKGIMEEKISEENLVESDTNECNLRRKSPITVLPSQDLSYPEDLHSNLSMVHEICQSQKTSGSLPVEAGFISIESDAEDDRINAMATITAKSSCLEHQNEAPNSSTDLHNVNLASASLERRSPTTEITQSDGEVADVPQILEGEVIAVDNSMNMSAHPAQLNSVEIEAVTCNSAAVPEVRQGCSVVSPVCGESATLEFRQTTLSFVQPSHSNLLSLPQMAIDAIPSLSENDLESAILSLDENFYHSGVYHCNLSTVEGILQTSNDPVEPDHSSFVSPETQQPSTSMLMNENTTHHHQSIANPGYMSSDPFQPHSVTFETSHVACPDPLVVEKERLEKLAEEARKIRYKEFLQFKSNHEKDVEKLKGKYSKMLQDANTEAELKIKELDTQFKVVLTKKNLANDWNEMLDGTDDWNEMLDGTVRTAAEYTEQVAIPSSSSYHVSPRHHTSYMPAQRFEQCIAGPSQHPSLFTPMEMINTSTTIPGISTHGVPFNPMVQFYGNVYNDGCPAPPFGAYAAASSYTMPLMNNQFLDSQNSNCH